jgi:hypothetical protein
MRKLLLLVSLSLSLYTYSQKDTQIIKPLTPAVDSIVVAPPVNYSKPSEEEMDRNTRNILALMEENKARQRKKAYTNIGIGVAGFAILIIGLMRRRKKTGQQPKS